MRRRRRRERAVAEPEQEAAETIVGSAKHSTGTAQIRAQGVITVSVTSHRGLQGEQPSPSGELTTGEVITGAEVSLCLVEHRRETRPRDIWAFERGPGADERQQESTVVIANDEELHCLLPSLDLQAITGARVSRWLLTAVTPELFRDLERVLGAPLPEGVRLVPPEFFTNAPATPGARPPAALVSPNPFAGSQQLVAFASGPPAIGATQALLRAGEASARERFWPLDEQGRPRYVQKVDGRHVQGELHYQIIVPGAPQRSEDAVAQAELAEALLRDIGRDTVWLHMCLLVYAAHGDPGERAAIPRQVVYRVLNLDGRTDLTRREKDQRCLEEISRLQSLGVSIMRLYWRGRDMAQELNWHRRTGPLWFLTVDEFGQAFFEPDKRDGQRLTKRWQDWQLLARPGEWESVFLDRESLRQFGYLPKTLFTDVDRQRAPLAVDLAIQLAFKHRIAPEPIVWLSLKEIIEFGGGVAVPETGSGRRTVRTKVFNAIDEMRVLGWHVDYSRLPAWLRPDLDADRADGLAREGSDGSEAAVSRGPHNGWAQAIDAEAGFIAPEVVATVHQHLAPPSTGGRRRKRPATPLPVERVAEVAPTLAPAELRALRLGLGFTQQQLAQHLGLSRVAVTLMEQGQRAIRPDTAARAVALRPVAGL